jgi:hypothetical protein
VRRCAAGYASAGRCPAVWWTAVGNGDRPRRGSQRARSFSRLGADERRARLAARRCSRCAAFLAWTLGSTGHPIVDLVCTFSVSIFLRSVTLDWSWVRQRPGPLARALDHDYGHHCRRVAPRELEFPRPVRSWSSTVPSWPRRSVLGNGTEGCGPVSVPHLRYWLVMTGVFASNPRRRHVW